MTQEKILKMLAGASQIAKQSSHAIASSSANFIEQNVIKGKYVSREEYDQLKRLVLKLEKEITELKSKK
ncbi:MAG: hypothetical protein Tsb006_7500 [Rickettsiaceae bacterium]